MHSQATFFPLVMAVVVAGCLLSFLFPSTHEHWLSIHLALGVVGSLVLSTNR